LVRDFKLSCLDSSSIGAFDLCDLDQLFVLVFGVSCCWLGYFGFEPRQGLEGILHCLELWALLLSSYIALQVIPWLSNKVKLW